jgi:hypothetical protein
MFPRKHAAQDGDERKLLALSLPADFCPVLGLSLMAEL